jgi:hypothetical protein
MRKGQEKRKKQRETKTQTQISREEKGAGPQKETRAINGIKINSQIQSSHSPKKRGQKNEQEKNELQ